MKVNSKEFGNSASGLKTAHRWIANKYLPVISDENRKIRNESVKILEELSKDEL